MRTNLEVLATLELPDEQRKRSAQRRDPHPKRESRQRFSALERLAQGELSTF